MNKYLEKTSELLEKQALNALKAREMAKKVGVIPDGHSAWKYALRNLRDGQGAPLQGRALSEGRRKLGDLSNNAYQAMSSADRRVGVQGVEVTGHINQKGSLTNKLLNGHEGGVDRQNLHRMNDNTHLHPSYLQPQVRTLAHNAKGISPSTKHRIAMPSGSEQSFTRNNPEFAKDAIRWQGVWDRFGERMNRWQRKPGKTMSSLFQISKRTNSIEQALNRKHNVPAGYKLLELDVASMASSKTKKETIASPSVNAVSANKFTKNGVRTVYFDHTPRKKV